jgi:butyrate kinase
MLTGHQYIYNTGLGHWLNIHEALDRCVFGADPWQMYDIIACHFGTGFTIAAFKKGEMIRVNNANAGGSFSDTRAGELPTEALIDYTAGRLSGGLSAQNVKDELQTSRGLFGHTGAKNLEACYNLIDQGSAHSALVYNIMIERIAEEIARRFVNLHGVVNGILLTGGMTLSERFVRDVRDRIAFLTAGQSMSIVTIPGSLEIEAMIKAGQNVLLKDVEPIQYGPLS